MFVNLIKSLYLALVGSNNVRYVVLPDAAAGAAVVNAGGDAAWAWAAAATSQQIAANCGGNDPCWLMGVAVVQSTWALATTYGDLRIGTGALASEVWLATIPILAGVETAVGLGMKAPIWLPAPVKIIGNPRLCAQIRNATGSVATGVTIKVILGTGMGT